MRRLAAIVLGLLAPGMASCDGGDPPSRAEFAERANEICREAKRSLRGLGKNADTPQAIADAVDRVIAETQGAVDELADLERPEGDAGRKAERFVDATRTEIEDQGIPVFEDIRDALGRGDRQAAQEAAEPLQAIDRTKSNRAARELGADACAEE